MSTNTGPKSIAEVMAEAEKQKVEAAKRDAREYAQRRQAAAQSAAQAVAGALASVRKSEGGTVNGKKVSAPPATRSRQAAASSSKADDWRDEFEYAIEAVEMARKSLGRNAAAVEKMATNLLVAKTGVSRSDAPRFIRKAIDYIDG